MKNRRIVFRGIRKSASLTRKVTSKAATFSGRVEKKADRIINGTDPTVQIHEKVLQEKVFSDALVETTPIHPAMPLPGRPAAINLLIPSLQNSSFFGGTATALIFAADLATKKQMPLRIVETLKHGKAKVAQLADFLDGQGYTFATDDITLMNLAGRKYNHYGYIDIHPQDIYIASAWWDAHLLDRLPLLNQFIYLIQDFEPIFYNNSDQYILAEETYRKKSFIPIFNTELMHTFMKSRGYAGIPNENPLFFEPAVNVGKRYGYSVEKNKDEKRRLFIYGRPSVHRNLFYRALEVIDQAFASETLEPDDWEVYMAGQDNLPNILLDCGVTVNNLGKLSLDDYYSFAKTIDLGLSLMVAPHPSYPPLELSTIGAAVVTTKYETKSDLKFYNNNIISTDSSLQSLVVALGDASKIPYSKRVENAKVANLSDSWQESLNRVITCLAERF